MLLFEIAVVIDDQPPEEGKEEPRPKEGDKEEKVDIPPLRMNRWKYSPYGAVVDKTNQNCATDVFA